MKTLKRLITVVILILVMAYVVMFTLGNDKLVVFDPIVWPVIEASLAFLMVSAFVVGVLVSSLFASIFLVKGSHQKRKVMKELKKSNRELEKVKAE